MAIFSQKVLAPFSTKYLIKNRNLGAWESGDSTIRRLQIKMTEIQTMVKLVRQLPSAFLSKGNVFHINWSNIQTGICFGMASVFYQIASKICKKTTSYEQFIYSVETCTELPLYQYVWQFLQWSCTVWWDLLLFLDQYLQSKQYAH